MAHRTLLLLPSLAAASLAGAQTSTLPPVTVQGQSPTASAEIGGFGDIPLARSPLQARVVGELELRERGGSGLRDLARVDASVGDAYNAEGYWDQLSVRGFAIDNRYNYRRDGLPINAETAISLANKSRVEVLKGTSGMQAGVSAPGGLVNLVVKRPEGEIRSALLELSGHGSATASVDLGSRFGEDQAFGVRLNASASRLDPELRDAEGHRHLFALAGDWRLDADNLLEAEIETSRQSQPSQPGFSALGDRVPDAHDIDPRINLNNQPWSLPVVLEGHTASLRWTRRLDADWQARVHAGIQRLRSDDRAAFPFGCYDAGTDTYYADRYCPDGRFDLYDYRSENERRDSDALDASLQGRLVGGGIEHRLTVGVLRTRFTARFQGLAYNPALIGGVPGGQGSIDGRLVTEPDPALNYDNTNRDERSTEFYLRDAMSFGERFGLWLGLRHTRLERASITTSGTEAVDYRQRFTTPWLAGSYKLGDGTLAYASWGKGVETAVAPNLPTYSNRGRGLAPLESRQTEIGLKHNGERYDGGIALFDIDRPATSDIGSCDADGSCTRVNDGSARHRGIEASAAARIEAWTLSGSAMWLRARREDSILPGVNGRRPPNVPERTLRLAATRRFEGGFSAFAALSAESDRALLPQGENLSVPGWARIDIGARQEQRLPGGTLLTWRAGIDNLADRRAWKEAPYQFSHVYLYPMAPRTWRLSLQAEL